MKTGRSVSVFIITAAILFSGCNLAINHSYGLRDGGILRSGKTVVNGSVHVGSDCKVEGICRSINGTIGIGENSKVESLQSINGGITLEKDVTVHGNVTAVNGSVACMPNTTVQGIVTAINGSIELNNADVERDLKIYNGDISLRNDSMVHGDIIVGRNRGKSDRIINIRIEIADGSVVEGDVLVEEKDAEVEVILRGNGKVKGRVRGAEVIERE
jgi:predicted acyltransferase (DUF342 family)